MEGKILQEYIKNITKASTYFIFKNGPVKKLQEEGKLTDEEVKEMQVYMQNHLAYLYNVLLEESNLKKFDLIVGTMNNFYVNDNENIELCDDGFDKFFEGLFPKTKQYNNEIIKNIGDSLMYIAFGNRVVDSMDMKKLIEDNTEFKVIKDMSKGSKREDIVAFNLSMNIDLLNEELSEEFNLSELDEDILFEEYMALTEEIAVEIEEFLDDDVIMKFAAYKMDSSDNDIKAVIVIAQEELGMPKVKDVMKRLLTQVE